MLLADLRKPTPETVTRCGELLHAYGFRREIASPENFDIASRSAAYSAVNRIGIMVLGNVGLGKTKFLEAYSRICPSINGLETRFFTMKDPDQASYLNRMVYDDYVRSLMSFNVIIDDLGAENPVNWYGNKSEAVLDFILSYTVNGRGMLSLSTNLDSDKLLDRYTKRIDCLKEHMIPAIFKGRDLRQWLLPL